MVKLPRFVAIIERTGERLGTAGNHRSSAASCLSARGRASNGWSVASHAQQAEGSGATTTTPIRVGSQSKTSRSPGATPVK